MKIVSWNVNGLRACARKGFLDWLEGEDADVVALQEVRARHEDLTKKVASPPGWHVDLVSAERRGYSGVGLYSRREPEERRVGLGVDHFDVEGRLQWATFGSLTVVNGYFPNGSGKDRDNGRIPFKLDFYRELFSQLEPRMKAGEAIIVTGDFNTAHREIDLARPKSNRKTSGFCDEERAEIDRWLEAGWVDTFRALHPEREGAYSWWSQRRGVRERNVGWRIDYILASPQAATHLMEADIDAHVLGSDHCPIWARFDSAILD